MGLPRPNRLPKNAPVSVEDIYEQKDYRTPTQSKALPTILDDNDPKVVDGQTPFSKIKRKRIIPFAAHPEDRKVKLHAINKTFVTKGVKSLQKSLYQYLVKWLHSTFPTFSRKNYLRYNGA